MRILFISGTYPTPRYPQRGIFNRLMMAGLSQHHEVRVVTPIPWIEWRPGATRQSQADVAYPLYFYPPKVYRQHYGDFLCLSIRHTIQKVTHDWNPNVVIGYWAHPDGEAAVRLADRFGVPSIVMVGGTDIKVRTQDARRRACIHRVLQRATAVVTFGDDLVKAVLDLGIQPRKVRCIPRGVDTSTFRPGSRRVACRQVNIDPDRHQLLWVGRFAAIKRPDRALEIATALKRRFGNGFQLTMIGDGPLRPQISRRIRKEGLQSIVTIRHSIDHDQLANWYRAASATILTSDSEGIPNVLRESQACGTPFVSTNVGGIQQIARPGIDQLIALDSLDRFPDAVLRSTELGRDLESSKAIAATRTMDEMVSDLDRLLTELPNLASDDDGVDQPRATCLKPIRGRRTNHDIDKELVS